VEHLDVLIVGAGLSGIGAAYHIQSAHPKKSYATLEAREALGGTWDLFRYPGIRSDSDMFTLGYSFRPWRNAKAIADGPSILAYIRETAEAYGIDRKIRYRHRVQQLSWSSRDARWTVGVHDGASSIQLTCGFIILCSGYYDYDEGYTPELEGRERFAGRIVHPQKWTPDIDYTGKRVVVIGSGATAVTLVPELAKRAAHVTMLQRSPTYIVSRPANDRIADWLQKHLPTRLAHALVRWRYVLLGQAFYTYSRRYPDHAARFLIGRVKRELRGVLDVKTHFTPTYKPWDQRLCLIPDSDLFEAIRTGSVSIVTDHIESFNETGITLRSGKHLDADLIVTATGLKLKVLGGIEATVDGKRIDPSKLLVYRGVMCSDVPNLAFATGYTNASWTLKADLTAQYVSRLLTYMDRRGYTRCGPRRNDPSMKEVPSIELASGYVQRAIDKLPRQGTATPWRVHQNYALDMLLIKYGRVNDSAMEFAGTRNARG
jgi:cation diffusion facilitator CzcD-associated flavoprotein CzcO